MGTMLRLSDGKRHGLRVTCAQSCIVAQMTDSKVELGLAHRLLRRVAQQQGPVLDDDEG